MKRTRTGTATTIQATANPIPAVPPALAAVPMRAAPDLLVGPEIVLLPQAVLLTHPRNMRRIYRSDDVQAMAASIRENGGVLHALIITPVPDVTPANAGAGKFFVIDGNLRLAAARTLGEACPPLKCEIKRDVAEVDQLLMMVTANVLRYDVDRVSEGWHYRTLRDTEGLSVRQISLRTGVDEVLIGNRILLTHLDEPVQQFVAAGTFTHDPNIIRKFLLIPDANLRIALATRLAEHRATGRASLVAINRLLDQTNADPGTPETIAAKAMGGGKRKRPVTQRDQPMLELAEDQAHLDAPLASQRASWSGIRNAARGMCSACEVRMNALHNRYDEPAWALLAQQAGDICDTCDVRDIAGACASCPGVDLLRRLILAARGVAS